MSKYSELNLGQIEAMVNRLGGMNGVRFHLGRRMFEPAERNAYQALGKTVALRDFMRGWGQYQTRDGSGDTFMVLLNDLTDRAMNLSKRAIQEKNAIEERLKTLILEEIEAVKLWLVEFRTRERVPFELEGWLGRIKEGLAKQDWFLVFEMASATFLR